jgi:phenylacetate-CoA ligase
VFDRPYYEPEVETLPREEITRLQEARILQLVPYVYSRAPLTRHIWDQAGVHPRDIKSLADFKEKAPFINKDSIRAFRDGNADPFGGLLCAQPPHLKGIGFTSGTTGDPTPIPRSRVTLSFQELKRSFWQMGLRPKDYYINAMFTFREGHGVDRAQDAGFRPICFPHSPFEVPRIIEASLKYRPKVFFMLSTPLVGAIDKYLRDNPQLDPKDIFSSYGGATFGGETLGETMRQRILDWGLEVFEYSSLGDVCGAMECSAHDGMHTWEDFVLVENLDPEGSEPVADNEVGELVVTALLDDVAPLVRFRTDDLVRHTTQACSCGRTHGRMWPQGRTGDQMLIQGKSILPRDILPLLQPLPETSTGLFQIIRRTREAEVLELRVAYDVSVTAEPAKLREFLLGHIAAALEVPVEIELVTEDELLKLGPPQKIPRVTKS